jgi:hypothetical protein
MFPWAQMGGGKKSGLKIHTLLDLNGSIPTFIGVSSAKFPDNKILDQISIEPGAFYVMDKGYVDFKRLNRIDEYKGNINIISSESLHNSQNFMISQTSIHLKFL